MKSVRYDAEHYRSMRERRAEPEFQELAPVKAKLSGLSAEMASQEASKRAAIAKEMTAWSMATNEHMRLREFAVAGVEPPVIDGQPAHISIGLLRLLGWRVIDGEWMFCGESQSYGNEGS